MSSEAHESCIDRILKNPERYIGIAGLRASKRLFTRVETHSIISMMELIFDAEKIRLFIKTLLVKIEGREQYKDQQVTDEYEILEKAYAEFREYDNYGTPKPFALFRKERTIAMGECSGENYYNFLWGNSICYKGIFAVKRLEKTVYDCGKWLRIFHDRIQVKREKETLIDEVIEEIVSYAEERIKILKEDDAEYFDNGFARDLSRTTEEIAGRIRFNECSMALQHNDFSLNNLLHNGRKFCVLDFTSAKTGLVHNDIARLWVDLDNVKNASWQRRGLFERFQNSFLTGYGREIEINSDPFILCRIKYVLANVLSVHRAMKPGKSRLSIAQRYWYSRYYNNQLKWLKGIISEN